LRAAGGEFRGLANSLAGHCKTIRPRDAKLHTIFEFFSRNGIARQRRTASRDTLRLNAHRRSVLQKPGKCRYGFRCDYDAAGSRRKELPTAPSAGPDARRADRNFRLVHHTIITLRTARSLLVPSRRMSVHRRQVTCVLLSSFGLSRTRYSIAAIMRQSSSLKNRTPVFRHAEDGITQSQESRSET